MKSEESTDKAVESQHKLCFLKFYTKKTYQNTIFSKNRTQLRPLIIVSLTGGPDLDHSRFV